MNNGSWCATNCFYKPIGYISISVYDRGGEPFFPADYGGWPFFQVDMEGGPFYSQKPLPLHIKNEQSLTGSYEYS